MEAKAGLRASLIARLDELSGGIRSEQDLDRLKKMLDCAEGLLRVLRSM
jgi:phosphoribosylformimino-5-aminoimidazole carboxamide ribonucleotide (ProFAR) isomerase